MHSYNLRSRAKNITLDNRQSVIMEQKNREIFPEMTAADDADSENEIMEPNDDHDGVFQVNHTDDEEEMPNPWNPVVLRTLMPFVGGAGGSDALKQLRLVSRAFNDAFLAMPQPTPVCLNIGALFPENDGPVTENELVNSTTTPLDQIQDMNHKLCGNVRMRMHNYDCSCFRPRQPLPHQFAECEDPPYGTFPYPVLNSSINFLKFCQDQGPYVQNLKLTVVWKDLNLLAIVMDRHLPNVRSIELEFFNCGCAEWPEDTFFTFNPKPTLVNIKIRIPFNGADCSAHFGMAKALVKAAPNLKQLEIHSRAAYMSFELSDHKHLTDLRLKFADYNFPQDDDCLNDLFCLRGLRIQIEYSRFPGMLRIMKDMITQFWDKGRVNAMKLTFNHPRFGFVGGVRSAETLSDTKKLLQELEKDVKDQFGGLIGFMHLHIYV